MSRSARFSKVARRTHYEYHLTVQGTRIDKTGTASLSSQINSLNSAMLLQNQDLSFVVNGTTVHSFVSADTLNGIRVSSGPDKPLNPPTGSRTEYLNQWTYSIEFSWEIESAETNLAGFEETITVKGGGPAFVIKRSFEGVPQIQTTSAFTEYYATQMGTAIGWSSYPSYPTFAYPLGTFDSDSSYQRVSTPLLWGRNANRLVPIEWRYSFKSPAPLLIGPPTIPTFT